MWVSLRQQRPPLLPRVDFQRGLYQITGRLLRRNHHLHGPQAPPDGHVEQQLRQPAAGRLRRRGKPSGDVNEASGPANQAGVSLRREGLEGPVGSRRNPDGVSSLVERRQCPVSHGRGDLSLRINALCVYVAVIVWFRRYK
jgi:hypothetical protein